MLRTLARTHRVQSQLRARASSSAAAATATAVSCSSSSHSNSSEPNPLLARLDACIARRECDQALAVLEQLQLDQRQPPARALQRLALLAAKQRSVALVSRAHELLVGVYRLPGLKPDDYTQLASIHVVDSCARHGLLDEAVETYEEAFNQGVFLDLSAYDALLQALVAAGRTLEAVAILNEVADEDAIAPPESLYAPLLLALVKEREYENAMSLLEKGQSRGVTFTGEAFTALIDCADKEEDPTDALVMLLTYIEDLWEDAKLFEGLEDELDDDDDDDDDDDRREQ